MESDLFDLFFVSFYLSFSICFLHFLFYRFTL
ncbi:Uncharacterised protein [Enterobacter hormaechei]|nr:Uncharacterised protein [Enterobacter hormaechei]